MNNSNPIITQDVGHYNTGHFSHNELFINFEPADAKLLRITVTHHSLLERIFGKEMTNYFCPENKYTQTIDLKETFPNKTISLITSKDFADFARTILNNQTLEVFRKGDLHNKKLLIARIDKMFLENLPEITGSPNLTSNHTFEVNTATKTSAQVVSTQSNDEKQLLQEKTVASTKKSCWTSTKEKVEWVVSIDPDNLFGISLLASIPALLLRSHLGDELSTLLLMPSTLLFGANTLKTAFINVRSGNFKNGAANSLLGSAILAASIYLIYSSYLPQTPEQKFQDIIRHHENKEAPCRIVNLVPPRDSLEFKTALKMLGLNRALGYACSLMKPEDVKAHINNLLLQVHPDKKPSQELIELSKQATPAIIEARYCIKQILNKRTLKYIEEQQLEDDYTKQIEANAKCHWL